MRGWLSALCLLSVMVLVAFSLSGAFPLEAWAGPGGLFVKAAAKSPFGRWLVAILGIVCLPFIVYLYVREASATIRAVYAGWREGDLSRAAEHMHPPYFASQAALIERWKDEGKRNVCELEELGRMSPLWVRTESDTEYATLALLVRGTQLDYLEDVASGQVIKGNREPARAFESVWLLVCRNERWCVYGIESGVQSFAFARLPNRVTLDYSALQPSQSQPVAAQVRANGTAAEHAARYR
jgi:hypothetical protein